MYVWDMWSAGASDRPEQKAAKATTGSRRSHTRLPPTVPPAAAAAAALAVVSYRRLPLCNHPRRFAFDSGRDLLRGRGRGRDRPRRHRRVAAARAAAGGAARPLRGGGAVCAGPHGPRPARARVLEVRRGGGAVGLRDRGGIRGGAAQAHGLCQVRRGVGLGEGQRVPVE